MSHRDRDAPTLNQVQAAGLLPAWEETRGLVENAPTVTDLAAEFETLAPTWRVPSPKLFTGRE
jgi:hypothetical protein